MKVLNNIGDADLKLLKELYPKNFDEQLEKVKNNYPIQYLIGYVDFYDTKILVNENVLIPRFETEILVDKVVKRLKKKNYQNLIDICTGSGCIAIALKKNLNMEVNACDISENGLEIANKNALENKVNINYFKKDILKEELTSIYDCIISNPPYVSTEEYVSPETKYEPTIALYSKGIEFYERILFLATKYLNKNGMIIFEIGATQALDIKKTALSYFPNSKITIEKDYNNFDRFMFIEI